MYAILDKGFAVEVAGDCIEGDTVQGWRFDMDMSKDLGRGEKIFFTGKVVDILDCVYEGSLIETGDHLYAADTEDRGVWLKIVEREDIMGRRVWSCEFQCFNNETGEEDGEIHVANIDQDFNFWTAPNSLDIPRPVIKRVIDTYRVQHGI